MTETIDHTEPRQEGCRCTLLSLCPECYARVERDVARAMLRGWATASDIPDQASFVAHGRSSSGRECMGRGATRERALAAALNKLGIRPRLRLVRREG